LPVSDAGEPLQISPTRYTRANREPLTPPHQPSGYERRCDVSATKRRRNGADLDPEPLQ
jgi:hypothetical protein